LSVNTHFNRRALALWTAQAVVALDLGDVLPFNQTEPAEVRPDLMSSRAARVAPCMFADQCEVPVPDTALDAFMSRMWLHRMMESTERYKIARGMRPAGCNRHSMMDVEIKPRGAPRYLATAVVTLKNDVTQVGPERRVSGPMLKDLHHFPIPT
jgi:hypothetical protein